MLLGDAQLIIAMIFGGLVGTAFGFCLCLAKKEIEEGRRAYARVRELIHKAGIIISVSIWAYGSFIARDIPTVLMYIVLGFCGLIISWVVSD